MGPSGSGKSTLLHCLAGIIVPDEGHVAFRGARIDEMNDAERSRLRRTAFGFVFQFGQLVPELPAIENVALPLLLNGVGTRVRRNSGRRPGSRGSGSTASRAAGPARCPAVRRSAWRSPGRSSSNPRSSSRTSRPGRSTAWPANTCMELLTQAATDQGVAVVLVTHEARVAAYAHREIIVRDGRLSGVDAS